MKKYKEIEVDSIQPDLNQPRKKFEGIDNLMKSIETSGLINPIAVVPTNSHYQIICGERRYRAFRNLYESGKEGYETIPAFIYEIGTSKKEVLVNQLAENLQRRNLDIIEEAEGYKAALAKTKISQKDLAEQLGIKESHMSKMVNVAKMPNVIKEEAREIGAPREILFEINILRKTDLEKVELWNQIKNDPTVKNVKAVKLAEKVVVADEKPQEPEIIEESTPTKPEKSDKIDTPAKVEQQEKADEPKSQKDQGWDLVQELFTALCNMLQSQKPEDIFEYISVEDAQKLIKKYGK